MRWDKYNEGGLRSGVRNEGYCRWDRGPVGQGIRYMGGPLDHQ